LSRIVTILPKGEGFKEEHFGAIALCVRDFTRFSRYHTGTLVIGGMQVRGFDGIRYMKAPQARWFENRTRAYARGCADIIAQEHPVLAEIHNRPRLLRLIARGTPCKLALHLHNDPQEMQEAHTPAERIRLLARVAGVYCVSGYIRSRFLEGLPDSAAEKIHVVYNGLEIPDVLPAKENRIVFAGRMTEDKGTLLLATALRTALPQLPSWRAVLIGSRRHEPGRPLTKHEKQIADMLAPLGAQVELPGFLAHPATLDHFARGSIAAVPSVWAEPFGRTALEAMAYGCAVISSGRGALREVTADAALTLPQMTPEALAHAILALAQDENLRASYARLARERAPYFAIGARTGALDAARDSILSQRAAHAG
jgi:glycosyltransferase involved in cell wall biosynthesis